MTTLVDAVRMGKAPWLKFAGAAIVVLLVAAAVMPNLNRARLSPEASPSAARQQALRSELAYSAGPLKSKPAAFPQIEEAADQAIAPNAGSDAAKGRKIIRTTSLEIVVEHPGQIADRIRALAQNMGGYLVSAEGGGDTATATLTVRVPAAHFEEARREIRALGLRVESEKLEAQDVTEQYVDQDANLRNLRAEEAQYLTILKQASTVKDMLLVTGKLSGVRGQIEQQQAEFNALSQQVETVAITISLRTETEEQVLGLNWRPLRQLKVALRDGLESLATYVTAMVTILFYVPAALLWLGTIALTLVGAWKIVGWVARRWFAGKTSAAPVQG